MSQNIVGRTFGDFLIKERIGQGGSGEVYRAEQVSLGREAVVKVMIQREVGPSGAADRFLREARLASRLDHPYAAHVYAFGVEADTTMWIAMEHVRGTPLNDIIAKQGRIPLPRFVPLFERLCEVLNAAHEQNIVHRDIKPGNVMVIQRAGRLLPKLLDLGIARATQRQDVEGPEDQLPVDVPDRAVRGEHTTSSDEMVGRLTESESIQLTQVGTVVGTPHFMAPEQWVDASNAGPAADVYSLSILAYQCITGRLPFKAKSLKALARAHSTEELPPLGPEFGDELDRVLATGAAKVVGQRYPTPLAFAAALRAAAKVGVEPPSLPQFDEGLRDNVLSEAPQPLAEAVAALESARSTRQAVDAALTVLRVFTRLCGVFALAARLRIGPGTERDSVGVKALLKTLHTSRLSDLQWVALVKQLLAPFARSQDAHPLPELVRFFFDGAEAASGSKRLDALLTLPAVVPSASDGRDDAALAHLEKLVPLLGELLDQATFMLDFAIVVQRDDAERWVGTRRARRLVQVLQTPAKPGDVLLVDGAGLIALTLSPLVQCFAPSANAPEELFILDGQGRHGARLVAWPSPFERQDEEVWASLIEQGVLEAENASAETVEQAPYKGLTTFSPDDADRFFGREKEAERFANRLRAERFLAVVGPSGTGKSSFILAGVLPLLPSTWRHAIFRPGAAPMTSLWARIFGERLPTDSPLNAVQCADALVRRIEADAVLVLVVDQLEELVTLCPDPAARLEFANTLVAMAQHRSGRLRVVATFRDDFLIKVQALTPFREAFAGWLELLNTPAADDLRRVVTEPARRVGYSFDDRTLPDRMVQAVADYPGALALLSFTASQLWELRNRHLLLMRAKTYEALGGVGGALAHHAEGTLSLLSEAERALVREVFRNLVTAQGTRAVLSRQELINVLGGEPAAQTVLEKLVSARLLVSSENASGEDGIEIIHEALIVSWPRLVAWQREDLEAARLRDALRASARQWAERGRPSGLLWRKETLAEYRRWRERFPGRLTQVEEAFTGTSLREEARARLIRRALAVTAFVVLAAGLVFVTKAYGEATRRLQRLWQEQGRLAMLESKPMEALAYSMAAHEAGAKNHALESVIQASAAALQGSLGVVTHLNGAVSKLEVSPDGKWLLARGGAELVLLASDDFSVKQRFAWRCGGATFSADSRALVATCGHTLKTVSLVTMSEREYSLPSVMYEVARLGPEHFTGHCEGDTIFTFTLSGEVKPLITVPNAQILSAAVVGPDQVVVYAGVYEEFEFTPHSLRLVSSSGRLLFETEPFESPVNRVAFDAQRNLIALTRANGTLAAFDTVTHERKWQTRSANANINDLALTPSGGLVTTAMNGAVTLYDFNTGEPRFSQTYSRTAVATLAFSQAGDVIFFSGTDGVIRKVDATSGALLFEHHGHHGLVSSMAVVNESLLTGGLDGLVWRWSATHPSVTRLSERELVGAQASNGYVAAATNEELMVWSPDGGLVVTPLPPDDFGKLATLDIAQTGAVLFEHIEHAKVVREGTVVWRAPGPTQSATISTDGTRVAVALPTRRVDVWSLDDAKTPLWSAEVTDSYAFLLFDDLLVGDSTTGDLVVWKIGSAGDAPKRVPTAQKPFFRLMRTGSRNHFLTLGEDRSILLWSVDDLEKPLASLRDLPARAMTANISADLSSVFYIANTGVLRTVDVSQGAEVAVRSTVGSTLLAAFEPTLGVLITQDADKRPVLSSPTSGVAYDALKEISRCRLSIEMRNEKLEPKTPLPCAR